MRLKAGNALSVMSESNPIEQGTEVLDTLLGHLGFAATIHEDPSGDGPGLQVESADSDLLVGKTGDRLDDLQYLVNRIVQSKDENAPRIRVDVNRYREQRESEMQEKIALVAQRVIDTGRPVKLNPLNSYYRRIVHQALKEFPGVESFSPKDRARMKRITIRRRED